MHATAASRGDQILPCSGYACRMPKPMAPVTGIAPAGLGTATNLDDTERYTLEDLAVPDASPTIEFVHVPVVPMIPVATPTTKPRGPRVQRPGAGVPTHVVALGSVAILALAIALTVRDGPGAGPGAFGGVFGNQGVGTSPPPPTSAPAPTAVPKATAKSKGKGHGHGGH